MKLFKLLTLKKEARLFDAKEYLLKTFIAVAIGYLVGKNNSLLSKDMISLLFGMMLTLEPVNITGIKSGLKQIEASILGAIITGLIIGFFGYNVWTVAIAITATLYISLLINWREVPVIAVFTSIYMTQYVQLNALGEPSEWLTFRLRILALATGVGIAIIVNFVFSLIGYKKMIEKRIYYIMDELINNMKAIQDAIKQNNILAVEKILLGLPNIFNNIDWIRFTILDFVKDKKIIRYKNMNTESIIAQISLLRDVNHILYDICYQATRQDAFTIYQVSINNYFKILSNAETIKDHMEAKFNKHIKIQIKYQLMDINDNKNIQQLNDTLNKIYYVINRDSSINNIN